MGPPQPPSARAPTASSQDPPWLRRRERTSLVKNRMREICTSGSVRGGGGNVPTYSALGAAQRRHKAGERRGRVERGEIGKEAELAGIEGGLQTVEKQPAEELFEHWYGQDKPRT